MNENVAVEVSDLSKKYIIGKQKDSSLRGFLSNLFRFNTDKVDDFWALRDINFTINKGEVIGIIGRNGAGKSTLLKILSQITKPTTGQIKINGRIASLLEVGTGFHPELTGRENIFLNGTILGMSRKEVKAKFDAIVEFSGVEKFLDTPVKRYSSGMYVRLAFAVAAHLDPEILIIDEVLAVGDAEFQKKCLGKMKDVANEGRTVLFVSHNISAVKNLCTKSLFIQNGKMMNFGDTPSIISEYLSSGKTEESLLWKQEEEKQDKPVYFDEVKLEVIDESNSLNVKLTLGVKESFPTSFLALYISDFIGTPLFEAIPIYKSFIEYNGDNKLTYSIDIQLPNMIPGFYNLGVWIGNDHQYTLDWQKEIIRFEIVKSPLPERTVPFPDHAGVAFLNSKVELLNK